MVFKQLKELKNYSSLLRLLAVMLTLLILGGCSTKKNTWTRRAYHNVTSKYNVYWNGNESLKQGVKDLKTSVVDDYLQVLRVYNYGKKSDAQRIYQPMDRAIQKGSIGVQRHSMKFGNRERVRWIDDSYLMMGKAHFYKQDYISARRTFDFVASQYSYNDISNTANLWLAKTYIQLEQYEKAEPMLRAIEAEARNTEMPDEVSRNIELVWADYYIARENYTAAIPHLKRGINATRDKQLKTRAIFILGQIYEREGNLALATQQFKDVIRRNPEYTLAFEARINLAKAFDADQGDSKQIVKLLNKMLRDEKNEEYRDRIYYALAEIALKENDEPAAIDFLKKSVSVSTTNKSQQATSSLMVAGILFENNEYVPSQAYYDTAVSALPLEYPGYDSINNRASVLQDLVQNLVIVQTQDSLLKLAVMDSLDRNKIIDQLIASYIEEEKQRQEQERMEEQMAMMPGMNQGRENTMQQSTEWYFYNPNTLSYGYTEFMRKWGRRKLEDNWRISDKQSISFDEGGMDLAFEEDMSPADSASAELTQRDRAYYLQDLPLTEEAQASANNAIAEALNSLGYIYMERLEDKPKAIESYQQLNERYPENEYRLPSWYSLYKLHSALGETEIADNYKNRIITEYPDSDYAQVLLDPDYFLKKAESQNESEVFYERTYDAYKAGQYFRVVMNADRASDLYPNDTALIPRFAFLRAIASGKLEVVDSMAVALDRLIKAYPQSSVAPLANDILRNIGKTYELNIELDLPPETETAAIEALPSPYKDDPNAQYMVMIVANTANVRTDPLKVRLSDFNKSEFSIQSLMIKSLMLNNEKTLITVGNFENRAAASDYFEVLSSSDYVLGGIKKSDYQLYPISISNYPIFYRNKNLEEYKLFWEQLP
ncbi:MAG: tetratricopeptide repeat protein [Bacteroidetes bacterium]|nr:tetratricopeptide repeat protein [Bacteroidota bacterium]MBU1578821.1 tetratricopeptide repeat protein [Bacteroidota bacterium]MBU2558251.1 tetratricopeptide repeat protein [Bacteroidota bacterium]